jgi:RNA polymerase sigma-70 factor (ECF subfamily)
MYPRQLVAEAYSKYHGQVLRYITSRIKHTEDAEDLAQDVFLRIIGYGEALNAVSIQYLLFRVAQNITIDYLRRHIRHREAEAEYWRNSAHTQDDVYSNVSANNLQSLIRLKVMQMPKQRQLIFKMRQFDGNTSAEIAERLGLSPKTVDNHYYMGISSVRDFIKQCI